MKIALYTAIINPAAPFGITENMDKLTLSTEKYGVDCFCFTNNPELKSDVCKVVLVDLWNNDPVRTARRIKVLPHEYLPDEYDYSIWVDGKVRLNQNPTKLVEKLSKQDKAFFARKHDKRDCIYQEAELLIGLASTSNYKDDPLVIEKQMSLYRQQGVPKHLGLIASYVLIRKHGDDSLKQCEEKWWEMISCHSRRDQLAFPYAVWLTGFDYDNIVDSDFHQYFRVGQHRIKNGKIRNVV